MGRVAVVSDTTHYLPAELVAQREIGLVSLYVNWEGRQERESDVGDLGGYYDHLRGAVDLPTTSQPSVGDFLAVWEPLLDAGRDVVSIHISAGISGTVATAEQAREALAERGLGERVAVIDSTTSCGGLGAIVLAAAHTAAGGADLAQTVAATHEAIGTFRIWFAIDTMEYLRRGGRVGAAQAFLGSALKIKPILTLTGEITPVERVRTAKRMLERMSEFLESMHADGTDGWMIQHIRTPENAERLVERGRELFGTEPVMVSELGPVIGTHLGPGMLGVGGVPRRLLEG